MGACRDVRGVSDLQCVQSSQKVLRQIPCCPWTTFSMFPMRHLQHMANLINERLMVAEKPEKSVGEGLKYFVTLRRMNRLSLT